MTVPTAIQTIQFYGADWCADCHRSRDLLDSLKVAYDYRDIENDPGSLTRMLELTENKNVIPTILLPNGTVLQEPSNDALLLALDRKETSMTDTNSSDIPKHDVIMIGAGPAALSAAIYTTREDIETLLFERGVIGGLAAVTDKIDNYPGFPDGIEGLTLSDDLRKQAERFGAVIELGEVTEVSDHGEWKRLETTSGPMLAKAVLIATGSDYKKINVEGEQTYYARGVHYCATCDGAFYRDKRLVVVGGGNSAVQESIFLTRYASHIDVLVRSKIKASEVLQHDLQTFIDSGKIDVHLDTTTDEIIGDKQQGVTSVKGTTGGQPVTFETDGVFIFIGLDPNSQFTTSSVITRDEVGFIQTDSNMQTAMPGVFAAGDIRSGATMQIASAAGEGATAALKIREFLEGHPHPVQN